MSGPRFGAVITAMVTPFDDEGALDLGAAVELARWLADNGSDGLVVTGTTGESPALTDEERVDLWRSVADAVTIPVLAGTGTAGTEHSVAMTRAAEAVGVDGILVVTPYYNRPPQSGIAAHFRAVAGATSLPVVLYDVPVRTGRRIAPEVLVALAADVPNIVGVKDATGDPAGAARVVASTPDGFELYCGDDALTLPMMAVGAVGVISVASHWVGDAMGAMVAAFASGDHEGARAVNASLLESYAFETSDRFPNPLPAKAACRALGLPVGQCRLPLGPAPDELDAAARQLVASLPAAARSPHRVG
ncbi:MAG: 4-hydroxy-tetrahydrodipicolinate synthase [Actinomycetota bacterium]|nr:4-hydroxy-tetrahydrodipicolinate synthase [Actinomycetota bacterium]